MDVEDDRDDAEDDSLRQTPNPAELDFERSDKNGGSQQSRFPVDARLVLMEAQI